MLNRRVAQFRQIVLLQSQPNAKCATFFMNGKFAQEDVGTLDIVECRTQMCNLTYEPFLRLAVTCFGECPNVDDQRIVVKNMDHSIAWDQNLCGRNG